MKREVVLPAFPLRIVSLVPSQTELLFDLGLGERVVGITKFCVHPKEWFDTKPRVGGTKRVDFEKIAALKPDLIIGNKELEYFLFKTDGLAYERMGKAIIKIAKNSQKNKGHNLEL